MYCLSKKIKTMYFSIQVAQKDTEWCETQFEIFYSNNDQDARDIIAAFCRVLHTTVRVTYPQSATENAEQISRNNGHYFNY